MYFDDILKYISTPRLGRYLEVTSGSKQRALKIYQTNLRVSQSFYPLLSLLEVVVRNAINEEMKKIYDNDKDWIQNQKTGFMVDKRLLRYNHKTKITTANKYLVDCVDSSIKDLSKGPNKLKTVTSPQIVANISLGFWVALFDKTHSEILGNKLINTFRNNPNKIDCEAFHRLISSIRDFRNRIYHNEPIILGNDKGNPVFSLEHSYKAYNDIQTIFSLLNLDFLKWTRRIDNVLLELRRADLVHRYYPGKRYIMYRLVVGLSHLKYKYRRNLLTH